MKEYIPIGSLAVLIIGTMIKTSIDLTRRPTLTKLDQDYQRKDVCKEIVGTIKEDLKEIKGDLKKILYKNGL